MSPDSNDRTHRRNFVGSSTIGLAAGMLFSGSPTVGAENNVLPADLTSYSVKSFGAQGDGATDDTGAIQSAIDAASEKGGVVFFPQGTYRTTAALECRAHHVALCGVGGASSIRAVGDFDTLRFVGPGSSQIYRNRVSDVLFDEGEKSGGRTIVGESVAQFIAERVYGVAGWNAWHFHNFNCVTLNDCRFESYRGAYYGRATGGGEGKGKGRSDVLRLIGLVHGGNRQAGIIGIDIDGFVHTVSGAGVYLVAIGAQGLLGRNSIGAESDPSFFTFDDLECDYPDGEGIRLEGGEHFYFNNTLVHATRKPASNIFIGSHAKGVSFTGGFSTGSHQAGIHIEGQNVTLSSMHFHANSSPEFGGEKNAYPGILLGKLSRDVIVTGCHAGRLSSRDFQSSGCQIEDTADGFVITGNDFRHNVAPGLKNSAGIGPGKVVANNL
jgi:hypothetical protein